MGGNIPAFGSTWILIFYMRDIFSGYYPPSDDEYQRLWKNGTIILDTNVLLHPYRLPKLARNELIKTIRLIKDQIWIPHQVGLEFQRRRLTVIGNARSEIEKILKNAQDKFDSITTDLKNLDFERRALGVESEELLKNFEVAKSTLIDAITKAHGEQLDISTSDPIRDELDSLLSGKIGAPPASQDVLENIYKVGSERYENLIPPGYADKPKERSDNVYSHNGLRFRSEYGDLILWNQIIDRVQDKRLKDVIFITSDSKEDWWWKEKGRQLGPRPELIAEIKAAGADLFWMYSDTQFLENAKKFKAATISESSVDEVRRASIKVAAKVSADAAAKIARALSHPPSMVGNGYAVNRWLTKQYGFSTPTRRGHVVESSEGILRFQLLGESDVDFVDWSMIFDKIFASIALGPDSKRPADGMVIVVPRSERARLSNDENYRIYVTNILKDARETLLLSRLVCGTIDVNQEFLPIIDLRGNQDPPRDIEEFV